MCKQASQWVHALVTEIVFKIAYFILLGDILFFRADSDYDILKKVTQAWTLNAW